MGRGRVQLKRIENKINKQVTFSKRRTGIIKKAHELSVLCEADVALIIFSTKGRLFEHSTDERMEGILERYERYSNAEGQVQVPGTESTAHLTSEYVKLKARLEVLQRNERQLMGEDLDIASLRELQLLEQQLDSALKNIRKRKNNLMNESISEFRKKEKALEDQNDSLRKKVEDNVDVSCKGFEINFMQLKEENAVMAQKLPQQQQDNEGTNTSSSSSFSVVPQTLPSLNLRSSRNVNKSGEILPAEIPQPISPLLPPWMRRALN